MGNRQMLFLKSFFLRVFTYHICLTCIYICVYHVYIHIYIYICIHIFVIYLLIYLFIVYIYIYIINVIHNGICFFTYLNIRFKHNVRRLYVVLTFKSEGI